MHNNIESLPGTAKLKEDIYLFLDQYLQTRELIKREQTKEIAANQGKSDHPSKCPKGFICPGTEVPEKNGKFCKHYRPNTKACVKGKIEKEMIK